MYRHDEGNEVVKVLRLATETTNVRTRSAISVNAFSFDLLAADTPNQTR